MLTTSAQSRLAGWSWQVGVGRLELAGWSSEVLLCYSCCKDGVGS